MRDWSAPERVIFGIDVELDVHLALLKKAQCFAQLRKQLQSEKLNLGNLQGHSKIKKNTFEENIKRVVKGGLEARVLVPLLSREEAEGPGQEEGGHSIHMLILCCCTLSDSSFKQIESHGLINDFANLLKSVIGDCALHSGAMGKFFAIIKEVCKNHDNDVARLLMGLYLRSSYRNKISNK
jgi:hypothetical protein